MKLKVLIPAVTVLLYVASCKKSGEPVSEPNYGSLKLTAYTVDTFIFKAELNDVLLVDSLNTPIGEKSATYSFTDNTGRLIITDLKTNGVVKDTTIALKTGLTIISIVQFLTGTTPNIPVLPSEADPSPGNVKARIQYAPPVSAAVPFFDSVACIIRTNGSTIIDTVVLSKYEESAFYETRQGNTLNLKIYNPVTGAPIDNTTNNINTSGFPNFNTIIVYGTSSGSPYNFSLRRIY